MEIITILQQILTDPWMLSFTALWGLGYYLKTYTTLKPEWVLPVVGMLLGWVLIERSIGGAIVGGVMALMQMGAYDMVKPMLKKGV